MQSQLKKSAQRVQEVLQSHQLEIKIVEFSELTRTAQEAATAIGCTVGQIAKTLVFKGKNSGEPIVVIASGINRVNEKKVKLLINEPLEKADAKFVLEQTSFAIGGIPPIGYSLKINPLIDEDLMEYDKVWAAAGTPNSVFCISPKELLKITQGTVVSIKN